MDSMGIGTLARRAGVRIDTVRYYEKSGLLSPRLRLASGYRRYELLALSRRRDVPRVKHAAQAKLADVERRISDLQRVRAGLRHLVAACPGSGRAEDCPILKALGAEGPQ